MNQGKKEKTQNFSNNLDEDYVLDNYNKKKLLSFPLKFNNNKHYSCWLCKILDSAKTKTKYESINIVSETGDSIYTTLMTGIKAISEGQVYISFPEIRKIVNEEVEKRLGPSLNINDVY